MARVDPVGPSSLSLLDTRRHVLRGAVDNRWSGAPIRSVALSPDESHLAVLSGDDIVWLDLSKGAVAGRTKELKQPVALLCGAVGQGKGN